MFPDFGRANVKSVHVNVGVSAFLCLKKKDVKVEARQTKLN